MDTEDIAGPAIESTGTPSGDGYRATEDIAGPAIEATINIILYIPKKQLGFVVYNVLLCLQTPGQNKRSFQLLHLRQTEISNKGWSAGIQNSVWCNDDKFTVGWYFMTLGN